MITPFGVVGGGVTSYRTAPTGTLEFVGELFGKAEVPVGLVRWRERRVRMPWGVLPSDVWRTRLYSLDYAGPVVRVHTMREAGEDDRAGGSGHALIDCDRESSSFRTGLPLDLRGSGAVCTTAAGGNPSFAGRMLSLVKRASWDERVRNRQFGVGAVSGGNAPVDGTAGSCEPEPLVAVIVQIAPRLSISEVSQVALLIAGRRRVDHSGGARRGYQCMESCR